MYPDSGRNPATKFKFATEPTVVISLDLELSWGSFDLSFDDGLLRMARWTHDTGVPNLLRHLTRNGISASWAVVGAMMRPSLPDVSGLPEVNYPHFPKPWFSYVPKEGCESTHPEWFGASLVEMIRNARPDQEIGSHSFSHVPFGLPGMTRERAIAEYHHCVQAARELGIPTTCFVFPRNLVAYVPELRDAGFRCFRDADQLPMGFASRTLRSLYMVLADFAGLAPSIIEPSLKEGIVSIPGSLMIRYEAGWRKYIPDASRLRRLRKGLDLVRRSGGVFHVWFHPENLYAEWPRLENVVARFLEELGVLVRNGDLRCLTMGQLASEFRAVSAAKEERNLSPAYVQVPSKSYGAYGVGGAS
jgi:peptidoglycan/xylan/chitin deacetylase (PgdA/CDA1 family)